MESFVIEGHISDERIYFVLLGDTSREMVGHVADYVASLEPTGPHSMHQRREIVPMSPTAWLAEHTIGSPTDVAVVVILGSITACDKIQVGLMRSRIGDRCLIAVDSETHLPAGWGPAIRLSSANSSEACSFEGMKVLLAVLLLPAVDRGMARMDVAEVLDFLRGRWTYIAATKAGPGEKLENVSARAAEQLTMQQDFASFETLIAIVPTRPGILMRDIHSVIRGLREALPNAHSLIVLPDHEEDGAVSLRLIAGSKRKPVESV